MGGTLEFTLLIAAGSFLAGLLGSLTGLGGGVIIVPLLTLAFGVDIRYAIGASLVSVIATSSGAAAAYLKEGIFKYSCRHVPRSCDDDGGGVRRFIGDAFTTAAIAIVFGIVLLYSAWISAVEAGGRSGIHDRPGPVAARWRFCGWTSGNRIRRPKARISIT